MRRYWLTMAILIHISSHEDFEEPYFICYAHFQTSNQQLFPLRQGYLNLVRGLNPKTQALGGNLSQANPDPIQSNTFNYVLA